MLLEASLPKGFTTFTLDEVFCSLFKQFLSPSTSALLALPGRQDAFLSFLLFQGRDQWCFYKSIGGSYLKLAGAHCDSVRGPVLGDNTLPAFLSTVSLVFGAIGAFGETWSTMPKCLLSVPSFPEAEHKARAEYESI